MTIILSLFPNSKVKTLTSILILSLTIMIIGKKHHFFWTDRDMTKKHGVSWTETWMEVTTGNRQLESTSLVQLGKKDGNKRKQEIEGKSQSKISFGQLMTKERIMLLKDVLTKAIAA
jgi:hypothetical protein